MSKQTNGNVLWRTVKRVFHGTAVLLGAVVMTLALFLILPVLEAINADPTDKFIVQSVSTANVPPPPPPPEEKPKEEKKEEKEPPKFTETAPPLDLSQLELALNAGVGSGDGLLPDLTNRLPGAQGETGDVDSLFDISDLDQKPRVVFQPGPQINAQMQKQQKASANTVYIVFIVDQDGRVQDAKIQNSSNPVFDSAALSAVKRWKFEPGKRNGQSVRFRMRVPITFPKE